MTNLPSSDANPKLIRWLARIESAGNRLPHPVWLFIYLTLAIFLLSAVSALMDASAQHPVSGEAVVAKSLLSREGVQWFLTHVVSNFTSFAPVGTVLVAMLGLGIAERSGLMGAVLEAIVRRAPARLLTFVVVLAGVLSSLAADAGYVVLIPLAAMLFAKMGRSPLVGIAAAFAGVSGGYSANLLVGPLDAVLSGLSSEAAALVEPGYQVSVAANYYFMMVSTLFVSLLATWVTEAWVAPGLESRSQFLNQAGSDETEDSIQSGDQNPVDHPRSRRALNWVFWMTLGYLALVLVAVLPESGWLRDATTGSIVRSPFIGSIVVLISLYAGLAGALYGYLSGQFSTSSNSRHPIVDAMDGTMATMASYLVLMFFAAQFVNAFKWTDLGTILAIQGAAGLSALGLNAVLMLLLFVLLTAFINLFIGSASAKWALMAPVFVPMLMLVNVPPEATQLAYRIGDSSTNIITPLMPYYGVVLAFVQKYRKDAGVGTLMAMMLPYSISFLLGWSLLLAIWMGIGLPLGA